jgi:FkbM family methyltransferase
VDATESGVPAGGTSTTPRRRTGAVVGGAHTLLAHSPFSRSRRFERFLSPVARPDLVRLGTEYGGWTVPQGLLDAQSVVYSCGAGTDISFDLALIEAVGCAVHIFDPTPSSVSLVEDAASREPRIDFHPWAIWSADQRLRLFSPDYGDSNFSAINLHGTAGGFDAEARSLSSIMRELGHERLDLLKLDIEGAEYAVLDDLLASGLEVGVACVEFHKNPSIKAMRRSAARLRQAGFTPVAVDGFDVTFVRSRTV